MKYYIYSLVASMMLLFVACSPEDFNLGAKDVVADDLAEGIAYSITPDPSNPNLIHLKSLMPSNYQVLWEHPQGRSQENEVDLKIPFEGTYEVTFGVQTRGGYVYGEPCTFTVENFCADFVNNELWTLLSGGVGESKKWFLDLDENGVSRYFSGPVYFKGTDDSWETITEGKTVEGDSWSWDADWASVAGWQFDGTAMDFGYMEFDLIGASNLTTRMNALGKIQQGKYMLNETNHTITFTDAEMLHDAVNDGQVATWEGTVKLLSLTENTMQLGVVRASDPCLLCFNYISEDYFNGWTPSLPNTDVVPALAEDWRDYVEPKTNKVITYKLSEVTPFDWCNLDGTGKNLSFDAVPGVEGLTLLLNSGQSEYTITTPDGADYSGTYALSSDGIYTFSDALPTVQLSQDGSAVFKANSDNTLRIMRYELDDYSGALTDLWLGSKDINDQGNLYQYMGYHFVAQLGGSGTTQYTTNLNFFDKDWNTMNSENLFITGDGDYTLTVEGASSAPYGLYLDILKILKDNPNMDVAIKDIKVDGKSISFDDAIIDRGIGDAETTARRYILNPWGETADDADKYVFTSSIAVTINIKMDTGAPFISESEK